MSRLQKLQALLPSIGLLSGAVVMGARARSLWLAALDLSVPPPVRVLGAFTDDGFTAAASPTALSLWLGLMAMLVLRRSWLLRGMAVQLGLFVVIGILQLSARLGMVDWVDLASAERARMKAEVGPWSRPLQDLSGTTQPDLARLMGVTHAPLPYALRTDEYGLRNPPGLSHPSVICVGDSILLGAIVPEADLATTRLSRALDQPVMQVAGLGYSPQEALDRLVGTHVELAGTTVLQLIYEGNDLADSKHWRHTHTDVDPEAPWRGVAVPVTQRQWPQTALWPALLQLLRWPVRGMAQRRVAYLNGQPNYMLYDASWVTRDQDEVPHIGELLRATRQHLALAGATYGVILMPTKLTALAPLLDFPEGSQLTEELRTNDFSSAMQAACAQAEVPCSDATPALRAKAQAGEQPWHPLDTHLDVAGQHALAEVMEELTRALARPP